LRQVQRQAQEKVKVEKAGKLPPFFYLCLYLYLFSTCPLKGGFTP
jgi:hypothetical protein